MSSVDLSRCRLYGILDLSYVAPANAAGVVTSMIEGGVDIVQLRAKGRAIAEISDIGGRLHEITRASGVPLVINDHPAVAREIGAEGVHVGQDDLSLEEARDLAGPDCVFGKSTHSIEQASTAAAEGADYIGFGPLYATPTKPDYEAIGLSGIEKVHSLVRLPIFCIGGIKLNNLPEVIAAGARRAVIVSGLLQASDIAEYARAAKALLAAAPDFTYHGAFR